MDVIVRSSYPFPSCSPETPKRDTANGPRAPCVGDSVDYFSVTHQKWIKTNVVRIRSERVVDLACRKNVDISLLVRTHSQSHSSTIDPRMIENRPPNNSKASSPLFSIGTKVEYFSESINAWIQSVIRGYNDDGSYCLNTKKSAPPSRVRILIPQQSSGTLDKHSTPSSFLPIIHVEGHSIDLQANSARILSSLNLTFDHTLSRMGGLTGGQNEGIYFISGPPSNHRKLCLKVVRANRLFPSIPTERERYIELLRSHSTQLITDKHITFPRHIMQLVSNQSPLCDVIVMNCAKGERMAELLGRLVSGSDWSSMSSVFERVGKQLKSFHCRYTGMQHGDMQVSNIYVDQESVIFIDVGGMSPTGNDVDYFLKSITILAKTYGTEFQRIASSSFNRGYCIK